MCCLLPELNFNLFSAGCAMDKGYYMSSDNLTCELVDKTGKVCAIATRENKLYKMNFTSEESHQIWTFFVHVNENNCSTEKDIIVGECMQARSLDTLNDWHCKLVYTSKCSMSENF